jgi:carbamate kinase
MRPIAVIAIGGNALTPPGERGSFEEQQAHARATCEGVAAVLEAGYRVVLTHGNGPQVGEALLRSDLAGSELPPQRLDSCDAETQGTIGYLLQQTLDTIVQRGLCTGVVTLITQVIVSPDDPAFLHPTKPIGPFYTQAEAAERQSKLGWTMIEDSGRGWRRVVASPIPIGIVELPAIRVCSDAGLVVITVGGGGIPVLRKDKRLTGIEAVIDKDRASALLAKELGAELLVFVTGVDQIARHFGKLDQEPLSCLTWEQTDRYLRAGEFPPGSMGPKVEAALDFLCAGRGRVIVTSPEKISAALRGEAGTEILPPVLESVVVEEPVAKAT